MKKNFLKIKMRIAKLDEITEASLRFEESNVFTSILPRNNKYLVKLIEEAWLRRLNKIKARRLRENLKRLPHS